MSGKPTLYIGEKNVSSWSMRPWVALTEKGIPFTEQTISLVSDPDRRKRREVSPTGRVPVLHHDGLVIPDSLAIIEYLEETYPPPVHPALWPADKGARAHARWLAAAMHSGFPKLREGMSFNLCFMPKPPQAPATAYADAAEMIALWKEPLSRRRDGGPFLFGAFSATDAMFAPAIVRLTSFKVDTSKDSAAAPYMEAVLTRPSVKKWLDAARALPPVEEH